MKRYIVTATICLMGFAVQAGASTDAAKTNCYLWAKADAAKTNTTEWNRGSISY